jgi:chromosome segregation ATPase
MSSKALSDYEKKTKTEISELNHKITKLTSTNELLENELNSKASKFTELQLQFEKYKKSHVSNQSDIQTQLDLKQTELLQLQRTLLDKSSEIKKLKDELDEANENLNTIREQFEQLRNNKSSNDSNTMNILNEQIKTKDASILSLKTEIQELKDKLDSQMQLNPIDNTNTNVSSAKSSEKKLKENLINLRSLVNNQKDEIQKLNEVNISLRKENEKMKSQIKNTETNKAQNELFLNQFQEMQQIYRDKENKFIQEKNDEIFKLQKENENLKNQLKRNANGVGDNAKFLSEISKLNEQKDSLEEDLKYYKELNMKFVDTQKKSTSLENENVKLKMLLDEKRLENEKIEREKISLIQEKDKLEKELLSSKEKMGELLNELSEAEKKSIDLNCELIKQIKKYGKEK